MISEIDHKFLNKYQRLYTIAESLGYTMKQIDYLFNIVRDHNVYSVKYPEIELGIRSILTRHNVPFDELIDGIKNYEYNLSNLGGKTFYKVSDILITYIRNEQLKKY